MLFVFVDVIDCLGWVFLVCFFLQGELTCLAKKNKKKIKQISRMHAGQLIPNLKERNQRCDISITKISGLTTL